MSKRQIVMPQTAESMNDLIMQAGQLRDSTPVKTLPDTYMMIYELWDQNVVAASAWLQGYAMGLIAGLDGLPENN